MSIKFFLFLLAFTFSIGVDAQSPSKILKQAEKALGGAKALQSVRSWKKTGTITRTADGVGGPFSTQASQPNLYHLSYVIDGLESESGYNGKSGWQRDSRIGLRTLTGDASLDFQAEASFRNALWINHKKEKSKIVSGGQVNIDGKPANVVLLNTAKGVGIKLYFDPSTGLPLREEIPSGETSKTYTYGDYRRIGGVMQAFQIKLTSGTEAYDIKLDDIKVNGSTARSEFDFPKTSTEPLPEITTLLKQLQENEDRVDKILDTYSFVQKSIKREAGKDGTLRETGSETFQLSFYKGYRISRLIEKNGKPLSSGDQQDADKDAQKRVEEIEKLIAKKAAKEASQNAAGTPSDERGRVSVAEVLRASSLINPRRERFRGRDVIVFDFEPNPAFDFKNAKSILKFFGKTAGVMWIDEQDKQVARLEAFLFDSYKIGGGVVAKLKKGASFTLEQQRLNDEIWLPSSADINLSVRVFLVKGIDVNQIIKSYDYRKFTTEVKEAKVDGQKDL
ncbi:MAG: hypothetical protein H7070_06920 [Saprospiraceae bacterium]|nr:hypothetical protein [Pyrinomonadaceae bacterium]